VSLMTKIAIVFLCFSLCGAGTFIVSAAHKESEPRRMNVIPVKNREIARPVWVVT